LATALLQIFDWAWQGYLRETAIIPVKRLGYCHSLFIACHYGLMNRYTERYVDLGRQFGDCGGTAHLRRGQFVRQVQRA
jgi:hypothetical protein